MTNRFQEGLRYGPSASEVLDYFPASQANGPLLIFVHGGNWQALGKADSAFVVEPLHAAGANVAVIEYGLAPNTEIAPMAGQIRQAVGWLFENSAELGFDPLRMNLCGTSAGAHLAAMAMDPHPEHGPNVSRRVAGFVLLSGIYDLEPVRHTYINQALRLDADSARRNSPIRLLPENTQSVVIARGGIETEEYAWQHGEMLAELTARGRVMNVVDKSRNHFDLPYDLGVPGTPLGDAVLKHMNLGGTGNGNR